MRTHIYINICMCVCVDVCVSVLYSKTLILLNYYQINVDSYRKSVRRNILFVRMCQWLFEIRGYVLYFYAISLTKQRLNKQCSHHTTDINIYTMRVQMNGERCSRLSLNLFLFTHIVSIKKVCILYARRQENNN